MVSFRLLFFFDALLLLWTLWLTRPAGCGCLVFLRRASWLRPHHHQFVNIFPIDHRLLGLLVLMNNLRTCLFIFINTWKLTARAQSLHHGARRKVYRLLRLLAGNEFVADIVRVHLFDDNTASVILV